jgi:2-deoxy-D-gluconate 3-dehydrogenase
MAAKISIIDSKVNFFRMPCARMPAAPPPLRDLEHRAVLVTGAARGIGRAIATAAAAAGARVALLDMERDRVEKAAAELVAAGHAALAVTCDVGSAPSRTRALDELIQRSFHADVLVNNAGVQIVGDALAVDDDAWRTTLAVNLEAPLRLAQTLARRWIDQRVAGSIVNVGSIAGAVHFPGHVAYSVSKAGLRSLTAALALELGVYGIRVNAVAPGHVDTAMSLVARDPVALAARLQKIPLGRLGAPEDVAGVVVYLVSGRASYITGQTITVDGGYTLQ